jgi:hypothetical protein
LRDWIADTAYRMQCPIDFCAVGAIGILAAVVGAGIGIKPKRKDDWLIVPNLWGGVIGPPSKKKTPALAEMVKALGRLEKLAADGTQQAKAAAADPETKARQKLLEAELKEAIKADMLAKRTASMAAAYADATTGNTMPLEEGSDDADGASQAQGAIPPAPTVSTDTQRGRDQARNGRPERAAQPATCKSVSAPTTQPSRRCMICFRRTGAAFWSSVTNWSACCAAGTSKDASRIAAFISKLGTARAVSHSTASGAGMSSATTCACPSSAAPSRTRCATTSIRPASKTTA